MNPSFRNVKMKTIKDVCPGFEEWPERWKGFDKDVPYGKGILEVFRPFVQSLIDKGMAKKTIVHHCHNLWLLGGEIIREVNTNNQYETIPYRKVIEAIGPDGGIMCQHLETGKDKSSYDSTCRKLYRFLEGNSRTGASAL